MNYKCLYCKHPFDVERQSDKQVVWRPDGQKTIVVTCPHCKRWARIGPEELEELESKNKTA